MSSKRCFKCGETKPLDAFYRHAMMADGRLNKCKECTKRDTIKNRMAKIEQYRAYDRMRAAMPHRVSARKEYQQTEEGKSAHARALRKWSERHPDRRAANYAVSNAVRDGKLSKLPCFICGDETVEAHHADYSQPLDVMWLCNEHHRAAHAVAKQAA